MRHVRLLLGFIWAITWICTSGCRNLVSKFVKNEKVPISRSKYFAKSNCTHPD